MLTFQFSFKIKIMVKRIFFILCLSSRFFSNEFSNLIKLYEERRFNEIISNYSIEYMISNKEIFSDKGILIYGKTYFMLEDYSQSLEMLNYIKGEEVNKLKFFIFINKKELDKAKKEIANLKDRNFFNAIIKIKEGEISNALNYLRDYLITDEEKSYNFTAMLIDYVYSYKKNYSNKILDTFLKNLTLELAYIGERKDSLSPLNDFLNYKKCVELIENGNTNKARNDLIDLINGTQSTVVKTLASYEYQKLN